MLFENVRLRDQLFIYQGLQLYKRGDYHKSLQIFERLLSKNKQSAYLLFRCGMCLYKQGYWQNAIDYFSKAKKLSGYKTNWDVQLESAKKNLENNFHNTANTKSSYEENIDDIVATKKYLNDLYANKSYWMAIHIIEEFFERNHSYDLDLLSVLSMCYANLTDYEKSIEIFEKMITENVIFNSQQAYHYAYNLEKVGNLELSDMYYQIALEKSAKNTQKFGIGWLHQKQERWAEAVCAYHKDIDTTNNDVIKSELYLKIAHVYGRLYEWAESAKFYQKKIHLNITRSAHTYFKCGESFEKAGLLEDAAYHYNEAILRSDDYQDYWYYRYASVLALLGYHSEAHKVFIQSRKNTLPYGIAPNTVIKNKNQEFLARYTQYYETLPIQQNFILLESFLANSFSCNPYALLKYMLLDEQFNSYRFVIVLNDINLLPNDIDDERVICIKRQSDAYLRYLCSAKYLINNVSFPAYFIRREEQVYLNTWHGTPLKTLGKDIKYPLFDYVNVARNFLHCTHIISQNKFTNDILLEKYHVKNMYSGLVAETGYPRVDLTLNLSDDRKREIISLLGLAGDKPIVVYAPTWRGTSENKDIDVDSLIKDLQLLKSAKYDLVFKVHHFAEEIIRKNKLDIVLVPSNIDTNELLGCTDLLISDYSSIVFDFLKCHKPIISYIYDFSEYEKVRGLYVKENEFIGDVCTNVLDVRKCILKRLNTSVSYDSEIAKYAREDDGLSCQKVINFMFNNDTSYQYIYDKKSVNLLFNGPYIPNGITRSFNNLLNNLSDSSISAKQEFSVIVNSPDIKAHANRTAEFIRNEIDDIAYHARVGAMPMTIEEMWIREQFEKYYQFSSNEFKQKYFKMYQREARRLFGDTKFQSVVNFEGYALFWVSLLSQVSADRHIIYQHNDIYKEWKSRFPYLEAVNKIYSLYDSVISVSQMTMENNRNNLAELFGIDFNKFTFTNNTILPSEILSQSRENIELDSRFASHQGKKIVTIGRLSHEKDHEKLIRAFSEIAFKDKQTKLYIIGSGPLEQHLLHLIDSLGLNKYVHLLGQLSNPYPYLAQADLFVLSSNHEGQPMVLLEALVLDKAIVATDIVGNRGVLKDQYGLLVDNSVHGLKEGLTLFLNDALVKKQTFDGVVYNQEALAQFLENLS